MRTDVIYRGRRGSIAGDLNRLNPFVSKVRLRRDRGGHVVVPIAELTAVSQLELTLETQKERRQPVRAGGAVAQNSGCGSGRW